MAEENKFQALEDQLKEAELRKKIREQNEWTYAWQRAQTEAEAKTEGFTDIFKQQESFNNSIMKVIEGMGGQTPTYVTAQAPQQQEQPKSSPNYIFYAGIGFLVYWFIIRKR